MAGKARLALDATYDILIRDADGRHLELESFQDLDTARGGSQPSLPNIPARKSPFGIATPGPSWPKPTVTKPTGHLIFNPRPLALFLCPRRVSSI